jgi:hypothetical protein
VIATYPQDAGLYERPADCSEALGRSEKAVTDRETARKLGTEDPARLNRQAWQLVAVAGTITATPERTVSSSALP